MSLYKIEDEFSLYAPDGSIGSGGVLIERQQVSAYTSEWIIFKTGLKDLVKDWVKTPSSNKGNYWKLSLVGVGLGLESKLQPCTAMQEYQQEGGLVPNRIVSLHET